ncbi:MDR family MFS transporter [Paenibacillus cremeus]|uniref:MFS transporter n=1 Tax=Paenibacillus cremeus TaxID=2163881 RepID=A0A559KAT8_9BACL|nr:MDR family MFS transporter [Paenibacillus cremeus]TVY09250.1 MFS transporter [Paenibacillus cremeus]
MTKATNRKVVTLGLLASLFVGALDTTVVSTAMPSISAELSGLSLISWVFSIYTLTTCVAAPIFGKLSDLFGRRAVFTAGLILFVLGSILSGASQTMPQLIWFRALQGLGAGALTPVTFTIIGDLYPGEQRAKMQGVFASVWSIAGLLGPLVGGYFVDHISWRWIFYMNLPIGIAAFICVFGFLHEQFVKKAKQIDFTGAALFTVGITSLLYALLNGGHAHAWSSSLILSLFAVSVVFILLFLYTETRVKEPMLPLSLFRNRMLNVPYMINFFGFCVTAGVMIYMPMWIQTVLGHNATSSGFTLVPMTIAWPIASNLTGRYMFRLGTRAFVISGAVIVALGSLWLATINTSSPYIYIIGILIVLGFGMGCLTTPSMVIIQNAVEWQMRGVATSTSSFMNTLGQTVGVAFFGTLFNSAVTNSTPAQLATGMHWVFIAIFIISLPLLSVIGLLPSQRKAVQTKQQAS